MAQVRTITISPSINEGQADRNQAVSPVAWIVRLDGREFTHGHVHALTFDFSEDAAQFVADLALEYGPDTQIEIVGLDDLGIPLPSIEVEPFEKSATMDDLQSELLSLTPRIRCERDRILSLVCKALFSDITPEQKRELIVELWRNTLPQKYLLVLKRLDAAFVIAKLKNSLPAEFIEYAEFEAAFRRWRREYRMP